LRIFHLLAEKPPLNRFTWNFAWGSSGRRNQSYQILSQSNQGFWFCGGRIFGFPIGKRTHR